MLLIRDLKQSALAGLNDRKGYMYGDYRCKSQKSIQRR